MEHIEQEREEALLGGLLSQRNRTELFYAVASRLKPAHFHCNQNRIVYKAIQTLMRNRHPVDLVTVNEVITKSKSSIAPDELARLTEMAMGLTSNGAKHYADVIIEQYQIRETKRLAINISHVSSYENIQDAHSELGKILLADSEDKFSILSEDCEETIEQIIDISEGRQSPGIKLGYSVLDSRIVGLRGGNQMVIGASTSVGKTTLGFNIAWNVTCDGHKVGFFSGEQGKPELNMKAFSLVLGIPVSRLREGKISEKEKNQMWALPQTLEDKGMVMDFSVLELNSLILKMHQMVAEHKVELIVIDYLQMVECAGDSREQQVSAVSRMTKRAAKELDVPVIILAQINREWAKRKDRRPELYDLRESGAIEQNTDYCVLIWRELDDNVLHCDLAKNRIDGRTGQFDLRYLPDSGRYIDTYGS